MITRARFHNSKPSNLCFRSEKQRVSLCKGLFIGKTGKLLDGLDTPPRMK